MIKDYQITLKHKDSILGLKKDQKHLQLLSYVMYFTVFLIGIVLLDFVFGKKSSDFMILLPFLVFGVLGLIAIKGHIKKKHKALVDLVFENLNPDLKKIITPDLFHDSYAKLSKSGFYSFQTNFNRGFSFEKSKIKGHLWFVNRRVSGQKNAPTYPELIIEIKNKKLWNPGQTWKSNYFKISVLPILFIISILLIGLNVFADRLGLKEAQLLNMINGCLLLAIIILISYHFLVAWLNKKRKTQFAINSLGAGQVPERLNDSIQRFNSTEHMSFIQRYKAFKVLNVEYMAQINDDLYIVLRTNKPTPEIPVWVSVDNELAFHPWKEYSRKIDETLETLNKIL